MVSGKGNEKRARETKGTKKVPGKGARTNVQNKVKEKVRTP